MNYLQYDDEIIQIKKEISSEGKNSFLLLLPQIINSIQEIINVIFNFIYIGITSKL